VVTRPRPGELVSGDAFGVIPTSGGLSIVVADGLGHGRQAAEASGKAVELVLAESEGDIESVFQSCHRALMRTRGAVMTVVAIDRSAGFLTWCGVGDVEAHLIQQRDGAVRSEACLLRSGVVGFSMPKLRSDRFPIEPGDRLVMATDGVGAGALAQIRSGAKLDANDLLQRWASDLDDALLLIAQVEE